MLFNLLLQGSRVVCFTWCLFVSERRKIERRIRRLEKLQRASSGQAQDAEIAKQLAKLKEDLEYVRVMCLHLVSLF